MPVAFTREPQDYKSTPQPFTWDFAVRMKRKTPWNEDLVLCTCSKGHTTRMTSKYHRIADDGTVHPSVVCPIDGCGFHEFVRLVGWDPKHEYAYEEDQRPIP